MADQKDRVQERKYVFEGELIIHMRYARHTGALNKNFAASC